jgi:hypothetical protein
LGIAPKEEFSQSELKQLLTALKADAVLMGTIGNGYSAPSSGSDTINFGTLTNGKGKIAGVELSGGGSYNYGASYYPKEMSAKLVEAQSFDVLVTAYVKPEYWEDLFNSKSYNMSDELVDALKLRLKG